MTASINWFQKHRIILFLALLKFVLPYLLQHPMYELHRDKYLYLAEGKHLAWGYMEVPPLLSLFAAVTQLLGNGFFWVKFWPALLGAINLFIVGRMVQEMGGNRFAQFLACMCMITGAYLRVHFLFQPNFLEIFFWSLAALLLVRLIKYDRAKYLYQLAICLAFSFYAKYSVVFFIASVFGALPLTPQRIYFGSKHLYLAALVFMILVAPNLFWQYQHDWPVVHHMQELRETQLQYVQPFDFLKNQFLMHLPCFFVWVGGLCWLFTRRGSRYALIGYTYLLVLLLLTFTNGKDYYTLGAYPMLFAAGGVWFELVTKRTLWLRYTAVAAILIIFVAIIPVALPVWKPDALAAYYRKTGLDRSGVLRWEDLRDHPLPQDFADMISWKELTDKMTTAYLSLPIQEREKTLVFCRNYAQAGAATYFGKQLPQVHTDNASFLFWMPDQYNISNLLFVGHRIPPPGDVVFEQFESYEVRDSITIPLQESLALKSFFIVMEIQKSTGLSKRA
ncbi:glycosyltransferase family 39 protein [Segetibacter sp. 3557_3]|uniref:glycosyltransferase family 39 protein n=1 Tax=Segetibacter sp. 3557_3 TaxID=2547429 RepID=UPI001058616B|nr:glycosyltransferase family 39 protein [Segetibacter sp. 3557_3]TDH19783.1 glycosyltransferase family 39 protein [Segetibacter sp. 3557_3]